jgi:conjugative relaxase-like TrwC/TraI family protein
MLSLAKLTSSSGASSYYEIDDYYTKEEAQKQLEDTTSFQGKLKEELNLPNFVDKDKFKDLLDGKVQTINGKQELGKTNKDSTKQRCAGTDMTFSAPKSMSILAEVLGKDELRQIHNDAVSTTLKYIEKNLITTQMGSRDSNGDFSVELQQTTKALFATFQHNTSRNLDPQLHTHAIAINITKRNGETKYRSTELKKIFENKMLLGAIYRGELASNLIQQGYEIKQNNIDGRFEIKNFPTELIEKFSTRRSEIEKILNQIGRDDAKSSATVTLRTRSRKVKTKQEVLNQEWNDTTKGFDLSKLQLNKDYGIKEELTTKDLINHSISILIDKESAFTKEDLLKHTLTNSVERGLNINTVEKEIIKMLSDRDIIQLPIQRNMYNKNTLYTTKAEIQREVNIINHLDDKLDNKGIYNNKEELANIINAKKVLSNQYNLLTTGQREAVDHILTSKEQIIGIQGSAGTGKTYMLSLARELLQTKGKEFIALAPSSSATKLLNDDAKIQNHHTLQHFLTRYQRYQNIDSNKLDSKDLLQTKAYFKNKVIILDESSLVSNKQMLSLLDITKNLDTKIILQGDSKQLSAVEAGKPFHQLQKAGMKTVIMKDILRQKNGDLKQAVEFTISEQTDNIKQAFQKLGNNIIDIGNNQNNILLNKTPIEISSYTNENPNKEHSHKLEEEKEIQNQNTKDLIVDKTLETYLSLPKDERNKTLILTPSNDMRSQINDKVREELIKNEELDTKNTTTINILKSKNITDKEKLFSHNYEKSDVVIFNKTYKSFLIEKDEKLKVIDRDRESIVLQKQDGTKQNIIIPLHTLNPKALEIYTEEKKEILKNEQIRFTKNDKNNKLINSHTAKVMDIDNKNNTINLKLENNKTITLPQTELKHFDYAYSSTAYSAQGKTSNNVIAVLESFRKNLTNTQTFYVEISRAKNKAFLITDNKENLMKTLENQTGEKISTIEYNKSDGLSVNSSDSIKDIKIPEKDHSILKEDKDSVRGRDFEVVR